MGTEVTKAQTEIKIRDSMNQREMAPFVQCLSRHGSLSAALAPKPVRLKFFTFLFVLMENVLLPGQQRTISESAIRMRIILVQRHGTTDGTQTTGGTRQAL